MPPLMSMKDFLAGGGAAVTTYEKTGVLPSYVARPKNAPIPSYSRLTKGSKGSRKKKKLIPVKKMGKVTTLKRGGRVKK